ncbi:MAG: hypothetical protein C5B51_06550 [Terriglobia bacterium]|nr:MAG: hypothetical protein C5B51_06550 [Terriglobia bacterium]
MWVQGDMDRKRKLYAAKAAVILGVIPILLYAYEYGPDAGVVGVPGETGTCTASGCHVGTANSSQGSVTVTFPNGQNYTPGVKQHLVVTIADPATTQRAWGFELTARSSTSPQSQAGTFTPTDANTYLMCASTNLVQQANANQACPANLPLQYAEHTLAGYNASRGKTGSFNYEFDWTPPSTDVGNIVIYVAGNAANGDLTVNGDHIYTKTYTLTPGAAGPAPSIDAQKGIQNGASFVQGQPVAPGSYVAIFGSNFASSLTLADTIPLSTSLAGVSVTFNGVAAPLGGVTSGQINAQVPWSTPSSGNVQVVVTRNGVPSAPATVPMTSISPGLFYVATDSTGVNRPAVYSNSTGRLAYPAGSFSGLTTEPAKVGDQGTLVLLATGLGLVAKTPADGDALRDSNGKVTTSDTVNKPTVLVGGVAANVVFSGLSQFPSVYQINVILPAGTPTGNAVPIQIQMNGVTTSDQLKIAVTN